jgi:hypothetical protein
MEEASNWEAHFIIDKDNSIRITIDDRTMEEANLLCKTYSKKISNELTKKYRRKINCYCTNMSAVGVHGLGIGVANYNIGVNITVRGSIDPADIDSAAIGRIINNTDAVYLRRLNHYSCAIETNDVFTEFTELFQILEDKQPKVPSAQANGEYEKYSCLRNMISHPELTIPKSVQACKKYFNGKTSIDRKSPEDQKLVRECAAKLRKEAEEILDRGPES